MVVDDAADQFFAVSPSNAKIIGVPPLLRTKSALFLFVHSQACGIGHLGELVGEVFDTAVLDVGFDSGSDRVFHRGGVADGDRVLRSGGSDDGAEGAQVTVFEVDSHLLWRVVGSLPELDVGVQGTSLGLEVDIKSKRCNQRTWGWKTN